MIAQTTPVAAGSKCPHGGADYEFTQVPAFCISYWCVEK